MAEHEVTRGGNSSPPGNGLITTLKEGSRKLKGVAGEKVNSGFEAGKDRLASSLESLAGVLSHSSEDLRFEGEARAARLAEGLAERLQDFSEMARHRELSDVQEGLENLVRRQPVQALGACFLLGMVMMRFLKSHGEVAS